ncbi:hypothetical protein E8E11_006989 [Didymella keratinophila]|nr:hypothetical protein E8E11_006989 [Didymella keratinophila]
MAAIDSSSWPDYAKIDPAFEALIPHLPPFKSFADYGTAADLRAAVATQVEQMLAAGVVKPPSWADLGVEKKEIQVPVRDKATLRTVVYKPTTAQPGPLAVYFHGGGWTFGWPESWEHGFAELTSLGITCVGVAYRLAPEHVFPTAANDACDSLKWCVEHAEELGADPAMGVLVLGTSAGANLAAVASHEAIEQGWGPRIRGVVLQYKPVPDSPYASVLLWSGGHKGQPPTYMQAMGMDPLRDDTLIYEHVLREENGVPTKLDVYAGLPHCAPDFFPMLPVAGKALDDLKGGVEWILTQKDS